MCKKCFDGLAKNTVTGESAKRSENRVSAHRICQIENRLANDKSLRLPDKSTLRDADRLKLEEEAKSTLESLAKGIRDEDSYYAYVEKLATYWQKGFTDVDDNKLADAVKLGLASKYKKVQKQSYELT